MTFTFFASKIRNPVQYWKSWKLEILSLKFVLLVLILEQTYRDTEFSDWGNRRGTSLISVNYGVTTLLHFCWGVPLQRRRR